jgi:hypothetical protein
MSKDDMTIIADEDQVRALDRTLSDRLLITQDIADKLGISYQAAQKRLWRAGVEPVKIVGRSNLYDPSVIKKLESR